MIKIKVDQTALKVARHKRTLLFRLGMALTLIGFVAFLAIQLWSLVLPSVIGILLAYLVKPLLFRWKLKWLPEHWRTPFVLSVLSLGLLLVVVKCIQYFPGERERLTLQTRLQYRVNEKYLGMLEDEKSGRSSWIAKSFRAEIEPAVAKVNELLALDESQRSVYVSLIRRGDPVATKYYPLFKANTQSVQSVLQNVTNLSSVTKKESHAPSFLSKVLKAGSNWLTLPILFFFFLFDKGQFLQFFFSFIPNRYFELSMTLIEELDSALGAFFRGTMMESIIVGALLSFGFFLIGINIQMSVLLGVIAGIANAIPFVGPMFGMVLGLIYSLIAENLSPVLPFLSVDQIYLGVIVAVSVVHVIDNVVIQPIVLGGAVNLHPLVVILSILAGSVIAGVMGMLFALPTVVVLKVLVETLNKELKAYRIIE